MSSVNDIRSKFLEYFGQQNDHRIVASSPLVPDNDPTLLFTNSGMVQFKNVFTGAQRLEYARAVTSQKCLRAGGKHNDLDNVGYTARHHTFFEMLGNFSFGDYFKERAIGLAWNLVTREFGLPPERLLVTVHASDDDAFGLWRKIAGLPEARVIRIDSSDNFWSMGETGPCGPCSEIFFDHGEAVPGGPPGSPNEDGDRFVEIWNLVFMQFEQLGSGERIALPKPSIDTGMGLERIAAVLQGTHDNYETDLFRELIAAVEERTAVPAAGPRKASHRVIADHLRASAFLIADGVLPANEGRGYVLRRIMRRAMRHAQLLGADEPLMWRLVPALQQGMGAAFPELMRAGALIEETLRLEELRFRKTLERGLRLLDEEAAGLAPGGRFSGAAAFRLHDTYGFPLDLTEDALRPRGITVDRAAYDAAMARQRREARKAWAGSGDSATDAVWFELHNKIGGSAFVGHEQLRGHGEVAGLVVDGQAVSEAEAGQTVAMVATQTPFYGESGGQVGDRGLVTADNGLRIRITDTRRKLGDLIIHHGQIERGRIALGDRVELRVDEAWRAGARAHHSATHLLHEALRRTLGAHVAQKGSLVEPERLRFDFSHARALSPSEISGVERLVYETVVQNAPVRVEHMAMDDALNRGARALFGEKYGDEVRVVTMGAGKLPPSEERKDAPPKGVFSVELCGGCHVARTGDIGMIKIISQSASAAGVRRIEAVAAHAAQRHLERQEAVLTQTASALRVAVPDVPARVTALMAENQKLARTLADARKRLTLAGSQPNSGVAAKANKAQYEEIAGIKALLRRVENVTPRDLRGLIDEGKTEIGSGVVAFVAVGETGKTAVAVGVTPGLTDRFDAVSLVRAAALALGGKGGGGRADFAQAGGPGADAEAAFAAIRAEIAR